MKAPHNISNYRRELCDRCKTPCEFQKNAEFRDEGDNVCPAGKWPSYTLFKRNEMKGVGDAVAVFAQPIAGVIDRVFGTKVKGCSACAKRQEMLNHLIPFGQKPPE